MTRTIKRFPVLLAGGSGTRLWPISREFYPKQLAKLMGNISLIQNTVQRLFPVFDLDAVRIVCGTSHSGDIARDMEAIQVPAEKKIWREPCGRNTAPAVLLALLNIVRHEPDAIIFIFPADHMISDISDFHKQIDAADSLADKGYVVTFGITPKYPETGYGYIEGGCEIEHGSFRIKRFVEKPDIRTAKSYIQAGNFFWNSGMFAFKASVMLDEFKKHKPEMLNRMQQIISKTINPDFEEYAALENISIDYAIMEKTDKGVVLPSNFGWSDIGSWKSLYDFLPKDSNLNVIASGDVIVQNTKNSFVMGHERLIAVNHLENIVVVETPDSVFISDMEHSRDVKQIVELLKQKGRSECQYHTTVYHSWGYRKTLEETHEMTVNRLFVYPNGILEDQGNDIRRLTMIEGRARLTVNQTESEIKTGDCIAIPPKTPYSLSNCEKTALTAIEVVTYNQKTEE